jgi:hypothetical protein
MAFPTAGQVTNMFLYGRTTRPSDLLDPSILNHRDSVSENKLDVDADEYMEYGPGRFVNSANFDVVTKFFQTADLPPGTYTKTQLFQRFRITYGGYAVNKIFLGTYASDYAERTHVWGTTELKTVDDAVFVFNADSLREIENFAIVPDGNENFDFAGEGRLQKLTMRRFSPSSPRPA